MVARMTCYGRTGFLTSKVSKASAFRFVRNKQRRFTPPGKPENIVSAADSKFPQGKVYGQSRIQAE